VIADILVNAIGVTLFVLVVWWFWGARR